MGLFRMLMAELACSRCGNPFEAAIQFKPGADCLEEYRRGERIPAIERLPGNGQYRGICERYCETCYPEWRCDQEACYLEALATQVERGRVLVTRSNELDQLSPEHLRGEAAERVRRLRDGTRRVRDLDVCFLFDPRPLESDTAPGAFGRSWDFVDTSFRRRMSARGWQGVFREDLLVNVDSLHRIQLRVLRKKGESRADLLEADVKALCELSGKTRSELAKSAGISQAELSGADADEDEHLSILDRFATVAGGELAVIARIGASSIRLTCLRPTAVAKSSAQRPACRQPTRATASNRRQMRKATR